MFAYVQPCALTNGTETGQRRVKVHCFSRDRQGQRARLLPNDYHGIADKPCPLTNQGFGGLRLKEPPAKWTFTTPRGSEKFGQFHAGES